MVKSDHDLDEAPASPSYRLRDTLYRYRRVLGAIALTWFALVLLAGVALSGLDARHALNVFGPERFVAGEPAVLRASMRDLGFNGFEPIKEATVRFISMEDVAEAPQILSARVGDFVQGTVMPPSIGRWQLEVVAESVDGPITARVTVDIIAPPPAAIWPAARSQHKPSRSDTGALKLDVSTTEPILAGGLPSALTVRAMDAAGRPHSGPIGLRFLEGKSAVGLPSQVVTDHDGLAQIAIHPQHPTLRIQLDAEGSRAIRRMTHTPAQFVIDPDALVVRPGQKVDLRIRSLHRASPVFIDVWHGERWRGVGGATLVHGEAHASLTIPTLPQDPALVWVQAYRGAYLPGKARGGRHLLVTEGTPTAAVRWLADELSRHLPAPKYADDIAYVAQQARTAQYSERLARYLLGRLDRPERDPPLLAETSVSARQTVQQIKGNWQHIFTMTLLGSSAALFIVLGWLIWTNQREVAQRWAEVGGDEDGERGTRKGALLDAGYLFAVLALFLFGMVQLLLKIRW